MCLHLLLVATEIVNLVQGFDEIVGERERHEAMFVTNPGDDWVGRFLCDHFDQLWCDRYLDVTYRQCQLEVCCFVRTGPGFGPDLCGF